MSDISRTKKRTLFWFDQDLRLDDHPALAYAAQGADALLCVYVDDAARFAPDAFGTTRQGEIRSAFVDASIDALAQRLRANGQALFRFRGDPVRIIGELVERHAIERVVRSRHFGFHESEQWRALGRGQRSVELVEIDAYTLFDIDQVMPADEFPPTFSRFRRCVEKLPVPAADTFFSLPPLPAGAEPEPAAKNAALTSKPIFSGGEAAARLHLEAYFGSDAPSRYKQTRNELDGWSNSGKFSPWLAAGCLSVRRLYAWIKDYEAANGANDSTYWLYFELLWREFFQWYAHTHGRRLFTAGGLNDTAPDTGFNSGRFESWCRGQTAWPLLNACMRELNSTGYLSNRGRQIAASALIHELGIDWRAGAGYFERQLIDYDVASNWGNWQYIAGVGADARGGRHFNIARQTRQYDPDGSYADKWLRAADPMAVPAA